MLSTLYLTLKYPLKDGRVGVVKGDQGLARKCYKDSLKLKRKAQTNKPMKNDHLKVNLIDIDPREDLIEDSLTHVEDIKKVQIGIQEPQTTQNDFNLSLGKKVGNIRILRDNIDLFAWKLAEVPGIDPNIVYHHLTPDPVVSPWPFYRLGSGIQGPFLGAVEQLEILIMVIDYLTKWVEAETVARITVKRVHRFY